LEIYFEQGTFGKKALNLLFTGIGDGPACFRREHRRDTPWIGVSHREHL